MARRLSRRQIATYVANVLQTGGSHAEVIRQLAGYLIESRRTKEVDLIVRDIAYVLAEKGIVSATVTAAFDLSAETKREIEAFLKQQTEASRVMLDTVTDSSVLGGIKLSLPGRELDQTIGHQLTVLRTRFKKV